jgi:hypothetical protein
MPRRSKIESAMAPLIDHAPTPVQPPTNLSEPARKAFIELVANCAPDHFEPSDRTLLARYAVACVLAEGAEATLQADPENAKALAVWEKATRAMAGLALRLRLGPQSRRERAKADRPLTFDERYRIEHFGRL